MVSQLFRFMMNHSTKNSCNISFINIYVESFGKEHNIIIQSGSNLF